MTEQQIMKERGWVDMYQPADEFAAFLKGEQGRIEGILAELGLVQSPQRSPDDGKVKAVGTRRRSMRRSSSSSSSCEVLGGRQYFP